jgi:hypothetical protein
MVSGRNENLSATMEILTEVPRAFDRVLARAFAAAALEHFRDYGLKHEQIWQRVGDGLYDYDLTLRLFNNQATVRLRADGLVANIQNARSRPDVQLVGECFVRAAKCIDAGANGRVTFQAGVHIILEGDAATTFLNQFADAENAIVEGGRIAIVKEADWSEAVRVTVERSNAYKGGVFVALATHKLGSLADEDLKKIADKFSKAAERIGLQIRIE